MIEPAEKDGVCIEKSLRTEISGADAVSPGKVLPRPGNEVLLFAGSRASRLFAQRQKAIDTASNEHVVPTGKVQSGYIDEIEFLHDVERGPILARLSVVQPIQNVLRQAFTVDRGVISQSRKAGLCGEVRPGLLEAITRFTHSQAARISLEHLQAPTESGSQAQRTVVVEPAVIKVTSRHSRGDAQQSLWLFSGSQQLRRALIGKPVHADPAVRLGPCAQPLNRLFPIATFVAKWVELPRGIAAPPHVLHDNVVAVPRKPGW